MSDIGIFYKLVDNKGNPYKNTSVDKIRVLLNSDIADFRKAILKENSAILTGVVAAQFTVYSKQEFENDLKVAMKPGTPLSGSGFGETEDKALVVVVPAIELPLLENIILEQIKELKRATMNKLKN